MLPLSKIDKKPPKSRFSFGYLPSFIDESRPPQVRKPFSSILSLDCLHMIDLVLPVESVADVTHHIDSKHGTLCYAKVMMSLQDIIEGEFFTHYIKTGNISMISEGRPGVDNLFSLNDGVLRLELDRATYERAGLDGKPMADGGLKHKVNRYAIQINLRLPSMLHGKKAFERMRWAFKNVLNQSVTWLFLNRAASTTEDTQKPIDKYHPLWIRCTPERLGMPSITVPSTIGRPQPPSATLEVVKDGEYVAELEEWISLVAIGSPRVSSRDTIDPYLCRYSPPTCYQDDDQSSSPAQPTDLCRLRWHGLLHSSFAFSILLVVKKHCRSNWAALQLHGFRGEALTVLKMVPRSGMEDYMEWELRSPL